MEETPPKRVAAFGRRSNSNSHSTTPRHHKTSNDSTAFPDKTDSARGSFSAAAGKSGGKFESILSFIAAKEEEAEELDDSIASGQQRPSTTRSASPSHSTLLSTLPSPNPSSSASMFSARHQRSMSATVTPAQLPAHTHSLASTLSTTRTTPTPSSPTPSTTPPPTLTAPSTTRITATTTTPSPFEAYKSKLSHLTNTITTLQSNLTTLTTQHNHSLQQQQHSHNESITTLTKQYDTRLQEQLNFIEQLVSTKQQLTSELERQTAHIQQKEQQLLSRHVELELEAQDKVKQQLEASRNEWRVKELAIVRSSITKAMEKELEKVHSKQKEEVRAVEERWREKLQTSRAEVERQRKVSEEEVRRQCVEEGRREREREERRRDELVRQMTLDFATKQSELSRQHEQERRSDRQRWEDEKQAEDDKRRKADTDRDERFHREWQQRLTALQHSHEADKQRYESECEHKLQRAIKDAEEQLRAQVRREGEAELAHVIERLGEETVQLSKDERAKHRQAIEKLQRDRLDEQKQWKDSDEVWRHKLDHAMEQLREQQKQWERRSGEWQVRWREAEEWKVQLDQLQSERKQTVVVQQHTRQHDNDALTALQQQLKRSSERWKRERQQLVDEQQEERAAWQVRWDEKHEKEMREVERRVKETVRKKDEVIDGLQKEMRRLQGQIVAMNDTIEQQKHELLSLG